MLFFLSFRFHYAFFINSVYKIMPVFIALEYDIITFVRVACIQVLAMLFIFCLNCMSIINFEEDFPVEMSC